MLPFSFTLLPLIFLFSIVMSAPSVDADVCAFLLVICGAGGGGGDHMSHRVMTYHIFAHHIISYQIESYHIMSHHTISCHVIS